MREASKLSLDSALGVLSVGAFVLAAGIGAYAFVAGPAEAKLSTSAVYKTARYLLDFDRIGAFFWPALLVGMGSMALRPMLGVGRRGLG